MRRSRYILVCTVLLMLCCLLPVGAEEAARQLEVTVTLEGAAPPPALFDGNESSYITLAAGQSLVIESGETQIAGVYLRFDRVPGEWRMNAGGRDFVCGSDGFLHEYVDVASLAGAARSVSLSFPAGAALAELSVWSAGELPDTVQHWLPPLERADLLLFSTHSDDEHLFFAGIIPTCLDRGQSVQVVYMTNHFDTHNRGHEQLNGLWAVGVRHYPIVGPFPDLYSTSLEAARTIYAGRGYSEEDFIAYAVEQLRRFAPQVVIGHDPAGEYSHGAHMINTAALQKALEAAPDPALYPDSAARWGEWDVLKTYLHLWPERTVVMNWDTPLASYGGKTAFAVSLLGYDEHVSQHWTWFTRWVRGTTAAPITSAAQITAYSPCEYGLYRSTVGDDPAGANDFFANLTPYAEQTTVAETTAPVPPEDTDAGAAAGTTEDTARDSAVPAESNTMPAVTTSSGEQTGRLPLGWILTLVLVLALVCVFCAVLGPVSPGKKR